MSPTVLCASFFLACALTLSSAQTSCRGRCGAEYYRGYMCQCDYTCLPYGECCKDYESQCTTRNSCKGRCGETFRRGRLCNCDIDCVKYKQCCPDYKSHCDAEESNLSEAEEQPFAVSEGSDTDVIGQSLPNDDFSNSGLEEANPLPDSTSGFGLSTAEPLVQETTDPTPEPNTLEFSPETGTGFTQTETAPTQADDSTSTAQSTAPPDVSDPLISTSAGTTSPESTTAADHITSQPPVTSSAQTQVSPTTASSPETNVPTTAQPQDDFVAETQKTNPNEASSDTPVVTTPPINTSPSTGATQDNTEQDTSLSTSSTQDLTSNPDATTSNPSTGATPDNTEQDTSPVTSIPASSTQDLTSNPDATTSNPEHHVTENISEDTTASALSVLADTEDPSSSVSPEEPVSDLDALTTRVPSSSATAQHDTTDVSDVTPHVSTDDPLNVTPDHTEPQASDKTTSKPQTKPDPYKPPPTKPTEVKPENKPLVTAHTLNIDDSRGYQADDSNDTNLCSGRPVGAATTLRNGTVVVFRGHYFWFLNRNREPGPARAITQVWGVPSPIDTAFTRCNCQGKTYIFKGSRYWRFENDVLDPDYPKVIETGFDGLRGHVTAALSVPEHKKRRESVYFFKRGGLVQKYSYQFGTSPTCGRKVQYAVYTVRNRMARQAVSLLGAPINIRTSWRGFPTTVTAAVSVPSTTEQDGYKYYVFSRSKSYNVRMEGERPVIAAPKVNTSPQSNSLFKCPKKV
ncbi:proteoglycan 4b isoform X2 [Solea solea]|uniref:proteoglycan 4b isoform X2 n=1 Tax=Solea solea TaxID=90069 RepID=UPI00272D6913|nr:proteoglycan 4b isoform X2 [Solea solea]